MRSISPPAVGANPELTWVIGGGVGEAGLPELETKARETASWACISGVCDWAEWIGITALEFRSAIDNFAMNGEDRRECSDEDDETAEVIR